MKIKQIRNATLRINFGGVDAYVLTHIHPDHFDMAADGTVGAKLDKAVPLFVQNEDEVAVMKRSGFKDVQTFTDDGVAFPVAS